WRKSANRSSASPSWRCRRVDAMSDVVQAAGPAGAADLNVRTTNGTELPDALARRVIIERIRPQIDGGRFPIKRTVGESVTVTASIFANGHDVIRAVLRDRPTSTADHAELAESSGLDRHKTFSAISADDAV